MFSLWFSGGSKGTGPGGLASLPFIVSATSGWADKHSCRQAGTAGEGQTGHQQGHLSTLWLPRWPPLIMERWKAHTSIKMILH